MAEPTSLPEIAGRATPVRLAAPAAVGLGAIALFFGLLGIWAAVAPLASTAIAPAVVAIDGSRRTVRHPEGGTVREVLTSDGAEVIAGQPLIRLDDAAARARSDQLRLRHRAAVAHEARLAAELKGADRVVFPAWLLTEAEGSKLAPILADEARVFDARRAARPQADRLGDVVDELREVRLQVLDLESLLRTADAAVRRTVIRAPLAGTVLGLDALAPDGIVAPGRPLLTILPRDHRKIIEARIDPAQIDLLRPGLEVRVRLTAAPGRDAPMLPGRVRAVSADRLIDRQTGAAYYLCRIDLDRPADSPPRLYPGMQAEVMIVTGRQTLLEYLFKPILDGFGRALRANLRFTRLARRAQNRPDMLELLAFCKVVLDYVQYTLTLVTVRFQL